MGQSPTAAYLYDGRQLTHLCRKLTDKLIEHREYIERYGQDMPQIRNWKWGNPKPLDLGRPS